MGSTQPGVGSRWLSHDKAKGRIDVVGGFKEMESVLHTREGLNGAQVGKEVSVLKEFLCQAKKVETRGRSQQKCAHQCFVGAARI